MVGSEKQEPAGIPIATASQRWATGISIATSSTTTSTYPKTSHDTIAISAGNSSEIDSIPVEAAFSSKEPENALVHASGEPTHPTSGNYLPYRQG